MSEPQWETPKLIKIGSLDPALGACHGGTTAVGVDCAAGNNATPHGCRSGGHAGTYQCTQGGQA